MTPVKILALLVAVLVTVKLLVVLMQPKSWLPVVKKIYKRPVLTTILALAASVVILKCLLTELTIIQIFATMSFMMSLMIIGIAVHGKEIISLAEKYLQDKNIIKKAWLPIIIWVILTVWVFYALFV
ncbi:MAG: hypothetical protein PHT41_06870 [Candidatus Omnitrophica bacterium]|nr:hypothetical protein [Candidatus Omnitrophota bacterium]MDD5237827.1 hypothetical protein [Candidatus Omnitrophota bacterium]